MGDCVICNGTKVVQIECPHCGGTGKIEETCFVCEGDEPEN